LLRASSKTKTAWGGGRRMLQVKRIRRKGKKKKGKKREKREAG